MFSVKEKQHIAKVVEDSLRALNHPEMNNDNIRFSLIIQGKAEWNYAEIHENKRTPGVVNPWNEHSRDVLKGLEPE